MKKAIAEARAKGVTHSSFGNLFLADIREYRVRLLDGRGAALPDLDHLRRHARSGSADAR